MSVNDDSLRNNTNSSDSSGSSPPTVAVGVTAGENTTRPVTAPAPRSAAGFQLTPDNLSATDEQGNAASSASPLLTTQGPPVEKVELPNNGSASSPHLENRTASAASRLVPGGRVNRTQDTSKPRVAPALSGGKADTSGRPRLSYLAFQHHGKTSPTPMVKTQAHTHLALHFTAEELNAYDHHLVVWVSILGIGCFFLGVIFTSLVAFVLCYRQQRRKWRNALKQWYPRPGAPIPVYDVESWYPHAGSHQVRLHDTASQGGDPARFRENRMQNDLRSLFASHVPTSLAEEDPHNSLHRYECQSAFPQLTTYSGELCPFVNQFSRIISSEGGEISSPYSDAAVFLTPKAIRKGTSRQVFVNVSLQGDVFLKEFLCPSDDSSRLSINVQHLALQNLNRCLVQLSPVLECISPGVQRFARPVVVRIPHRANVYSDAPSQAWELKVVHSSSPLGKHMAWESIPNEDTLKEDHTPDSLFSYDQDSVYIRTYLPGSWAVLGRPKGKHSALRLCAVAYAQCRLPSCSPSPQGLQVFNCDNNNTNQSSFPDLIVPTTSQTSAHCDSSLVPMSFEEAAGAAARAAPEIHRDVGGVTPSANAPQQVRLSVYMCDPFMDAHKVGEADALTRKHASMHTRKHSHMHEHTHAC